MGIIIGILIYSIPMAGLHIHYMLFPKYWADKFEFEILNQKMTIEEFDYWISIKFFAWPLKLKELCGR